MNTNGQMGMNRTGIATSGDLIAEMVEGTAEFNPDLVGDEGAIALARGNYAKEAGKIGSVPPPPSTKGILTAAKNAIMGQAPSLVLDKLGERLAFERSGVRLYEALLSKLDAFGSFPGGPAREDLVLIMNEEYEHFRMLVDVVESLGGDPTVMTPSADLHATISKGVMEALIDPRTNLVQGLEAILVAELADHDCWVALAELIAEAGDEELASQFEEAEEHESEHLAKVRGWLAVAQGRQVAESPS